MFERTPLEASGKRLRAHASGGGVRNADARRADTCHADACCADAHHADARCTPSTALAKMLGCALLVACMFLFGCAQGAKATESSPRAVASEASIESSSELTEESQVVDLSIPFDRAISVEGDAAKDFAITLDDGELNAKACQVEIAAEGDVLHVRLTPTPEAKGVDTPLYFACYLGKLSVAASSADGALAHVVGENGAAALLEAPVNATIPSGMRIQQTASDAGTGTVKVTQFAQIRCCTWLSIGGTELFMHHHRFAQESNETCAAALAETINNSADGAFKATSEGDSVTVSAGKGADSGKPLDIYIVEGVQP